MRVGAGFAREAGNPARTHASGPARRSADDEHFVAAVGFGVGVYEHRGVLRGAAGVEVEDDVCLGVPRIRVEIKFGACPIDAVLGNGIDETPVGFEVAALLRGADVPALPETVDRVFQERAVGEDGALIPGHAGFDEGIGRVWRGGFDAPAEVVALGNVLVQDHGKAVDPRHGAARFCARLREYRAVVRQSRKGINMRWVGHWGGWSKPAAPRRS